MEIEDFEILFNEEDLDFDGPSKSQLFTMYGIFLNDFHKSPLIHRGKKVVFNNDRTKHPLFKGKYQGFVHLVTRESKYTSRRQYDRDRANRIHWVRPILENWESSFVSYFEENNADGELQYFYWVQSLDFMIILREVSPDLLLVTAFCVDDYEKQNFSKKLKKYREK